MRFAVCIGLFLALSSCEEVTQVADSISADLTGGAVQQTFVEGDLRRVALFRGDVSVLAPDRYCVDPAASNLRRGFAVMAGCMLVSDQSKEELVPALDGLITVQFGRRGTASVAGNEEMFATFLQSDQGRLLLSQEDDPAAVTEVVTSTAPNAVFVQFEDAAGQNFPDTTAQQWRGFSDINGRLTTVSVRSFERNTLSPSEGERLLKRAMDALYESNESDDTES